MNSYGWWLCNWWTRIMSIHGLSHMYPWAKPPIMNLMGFVVTWPHAQPFWIASRARGGVGLGIEPSVWLLESGGWFRCRNHCSRFSCHRGMLSARDACCKDAMVFWTIFAYSAIPAGAMLNLLLLSEITLIMKARCCRCSWMFLGFLLFSVPHANKGYGWLM